MSFEEVSIWHQGKYRLFKNKCFSNFALVNKFILNHLHGHMCLIYLKSYKSRNLLQLLLKFTNVLNLVFKE